jgi:pyridoxal phosphate enzyme (YggS family)
MDYSLVGERIALARSRISAAAARAGRDPAEVELLAVTKFHPIEAVEAAWNAGIRSFGESRLQEAQAKFPGFLGAHPEARLDMIGHLQANKAKKSVDLFSRIQSVDSAELLLDLDSRARSAGRRVEILLELHTGEESKEGFRDADGLYRAIDSFLSRDGGGGDEPGGQGLLLRGLMTMAPLSVGEAPIRASFGALRLALDECRRSFGLERFDVLSMGMSGDYPIAVEEGSTLVRIGTALFGERAS